MTTITTSKWTASVLALGVLSGCGGNRETQLVGNWKVNPTSLKLPTPAPGNDPAAAQMGQQMAQNMLSSMSLDLKADKTFAMNMMFQMEGNWVLTGNDVNLTMTKMAGQDISKMPNADKIKGEPLTLTLSGDGQQLTMVDKTGKPSPFGSLVFAKQ